MGDHADPRLEPLYEDAIRDTIERFEATGSPVITDGEQRKYHNFWTYCVHGLPNTAPDGFKIPFAAGHARRMPRLTAGPFRYKRLRGPATSTSPSATPHVPVKQAVISPSALSLMYPAEGSPAIRARSSSTICCASTRPRCAAVSKRARTRCRSISPKDGWRIKLDPSGASARQLHRPEQPRAARFSAEERKRIGVHTCPGGDRDSTHSADVDYAELLPSLFELQAGNFYIALAGEKDRVRVLKIIREHMKPDQRIFVGVVAPIDPRIETPEEVRDRVLEAAEYIPVEQLGTTDDCGFSPFCDDTSTSRDTAFAKIRARVLGTALAAKMIEGRDGIRRTASEAAASLPTSLATLNHFGS